tara:strand:+ start:355 stop:1680 length:1326 start_codon:yes stop_codon:yes gene_type:complete
MAQEITQGLFSNLFETKIPSMGAQSSPFGGILQQQPITISGGGMSPMSAITQRIMQSGEQLQGSVRGLFGQQTPEQAQQTMVTQLIKNNPDVNLNEPEGLRKMAREAMNVPGLENFSIKLRQQADVLEEKQKVAKRQAKKDLLTGISIDKYTPKSVQTYTQTGNYSDLVFADKPLTGKDLTYHTLITSGTSPQRAFDLTHNFIQMNVDAAAGQVTETNLRTGITKVLPIGEVSIQELSSSQIAQTPNYENLYEEAGITMLQGVEKGTGILSGVQDFINITVGQATDKLPYPGVGEMRQLLSMATQELASKLRENVRADTERREIEQMLNIKPAFLQSKENAIEKIEQIHAYLTTKRNGLAKIADNVNNPRQTRVDAKSKVEAINSFLPKLGIEKRNVATTLQYKDLKENLKKSFAEYAKKKGEKPEELWNKISPINRMYFF